MPTIQQALISAFAPPPPAGGGTEYLLNIAQTIGGSRTNYNGEVGLRFIVGAAPITVTQLGRWIRPGNALTHTLRVCDASGTTKGSVLVDAAGQPANEYLYGTPTPFILAAGEQYFLLSTETDPGDEWSDEASVTGDAGASPDGSAFALSPSSPQVLTFSSLSFVPLNLKYTL